MQVGYLPDMFGHVAQMPQLLRLAGIEHAVVWRGVPASVDADRVLVGGARRLTRALRVPLRLVLERARHPRGREGPRAARASTTSTSSATSRLADMLLMNGTDHQMPQPWLGRVVAEANAHAGRLPLRRHVARRSTCRSSRPTGLPTVAGELRSGARANLLMGVASNRVDVHQACAAAERALERRAEPLSALFLPARAVPARVRSTLAWQQPRAQQRARLVVRVQSRRGRRPGRSSATTKRARSATGSSRDALHALARAGRRAAGLDRGREPDRARAIRDSSRALRAGRRVRATSSAPDGTRAPDAGGRRDQRRGLHDDGHRPEGAVGARPHARHRVRGPPDRVVRRSSRRRPSSTTSCCRRRGRATTRRDLAELQGADARARRRRHDDAVARRWSRRCAGVLFDTGPVDGFGWACFTGRRRRRRPAGAVVATEHDARATSTCASTVDSRDGTYTIETTDGLRVAGLGRLVDGGDGGDTYNYSPPADDLVVDAPGRRARRRRSRPGPVRARVLDRDRLHVARVRDRRRARRARRAATRPSAVTVAHDPRAARRRAVPARHARARQPRARPPAARALPAARRRSTGSDAECAFAVVHRGLTAEGGAHEFGLPTFPSRRFVDASDGTRRARAPARRPARVRGRRRRPRARAHAAARDRLPVALRTVAAAEPGGPARRGARRADARASSDCEYAVLPHRGDWRAADCYGAADAFLVPFERARGGRHRRDADRRRAARCASTAPRSPPCTRTAGGLVGARVPHRRRRGPGDDRARRRTGARLGRRPRAADRSRRSKASVELRPWEICTLQLS